ncbi:MAG: hypothetical protein M1118_10060 [Chloroflexi bacterium]|nr:hypothetical protein [Chloroflexota bacterium]
MASTCEVCGKTVHIGRTIRFQNTGKWFRRATKKSRAFIGRSGNADAPECLHPLLANGASRRLAQVVGPLTLKVLRC